MNILDRIVADTRTLVARRKREIPVRLLETNVRAVAPTRPFAEALQQDHLSIIAEIKKASPSKGIIRADFNVANLARQYEESGADAVSVLTEPTYFQGAPEDLALTHRTIDRPLLRKDFIIDPYQLLEARSLGADAVLLIAAVLDASQLFDLHQTATELGLACLVEVYDRAELDKIDFDQVQILGVNNRDLRTFEVDIDHSLRVFAEAPSAVVRVSESGLRSARDLAHLRHHGVDAVLIGETLMKAEQPGKVLASLKEDVQVLLNENYESTL